MRRREALGVVGSLATVGVAGCNGLAEPGAQNENRPPAIEDKPEAVYHPTHVEGMQMAGMDGAGGYKCALTYSFPHRFWLVTGTRRKVVDVQSDDTVHLMPVVWDTDTGIIPPDVNPQVTIGQDGSTVTTLSPWPMLSQPMGFHFGDNVAFPGEGTYQVEISIGEPSSRRSGSLAENSGGASFTFDLEFTRSRLEEIMVREIPAEKQGTRGAVEPMSMEMMPSTQVPPESDLPGEVRGTASSGDGAFVVTVLEDATPFGGGESQQYLAISARTPYNRYPLTHMSLSATLTRGDEAVYDDALTSVIDPEIHAHYGAAVDDIDTGDELTITVDAPPQTARHEGYETAFVDMPSVSITL
jgi:hypothetical protein